MIKAIIFDFDGLLIDTETPYYEAFRQVYREYGVDLPLETYVQCVGTSFDQFNPLTYLEECLGRPVDQIALKRAVEKKRDAFMARESLLPGVEANLREAKRVGLKIGLASSSGSEWVKGHITEHHIHDYFDTVWTKDMVQNVKPHPDLYLKASEDLGVAGAEAIAFEDSPNGLKAAKAAGLNCVVIPNRITANLAFDAYDLKLRSMDELSLTEVIERISARNERECIG